MSPPDKKMTGSNPSLARTASGALANKIREDNEIEMGPNQIEASPFQFQTFSVEIEMNISLCEVFRIAKYFA